MIPAPKGVFALWTFDDRDDCTHDCTHEREVVAFDHDGKPLVLDDFGLVRAEEFWLTKADGVIYRGVIGRGRFAERTMLHETSEVESATVDATPPEGIGSHRSVQQPPSGRTTVSPRRTRYAEAAVRGECRKVATATTGTRNQTLNTAAFSLGQLVAEPGLLDAGAVTSALLDAALRAGLGDKEARATIRSGLSGGLQRPRKVA
jgi:hypothetical protein